jgi:hypothetical protein
VAAADSTLRFGAPQELWPSAAAGDVAVGPDGTTLVVWATLPEPGNNQTSDQVFASLRAQARTPLRPLRRSAPPGAHGRRAAFDPVTGRPAIVWIDQSSHGRTQDLRFARR